jgi:hypothetical protein
MPPRTKSATTGRIMDGWEGEMARCRDGTRGVEVRERLVVPHPRTGEVADTNAGQ